MVWLPELHGFLVWTAENAKPADPPFPPDFSVDAIPQADPPEIVPPDEEAASEAAAMADISPLTKDIEAPSPPYGTDTIIGIEYEDNKGTVTRRVITLRRIYEKHSTFYVYGWCHTRRALRSFLLTRIRLWFDVNTGEILDPKKEFVSLLPSYWLNAGDEIPTHPLEAALDCCGNALKILVFLARCDEDYHPAEQAVILQFCLDLCNEQSPQIDVPVEPFKAYVARFQPTVNTFTLAARRLKNDRRLARRILEAAVQVIEADHRVLNVENTFYRKLGTALRALN